MGEAGLFTIVIILAGSFPLPLSPKVKADVSTAAVFGAAILLDPGVAALAAVVGVSTYTVLIRFWGEKLRLPWYQYLFNVGATALFTGLTSVLFNSLAESGGLLTPAVLPAAAFMYLANTSLVSIVVSPQTGLSPIRFWWTGTKENGLTELSLYAFGFLGAVVYQQNPWTVVALFIPVAINYIAFSTLARKIKEREEAEEALQTAKDELELRVAELEDHKAELSSTTQQLRLSRRRVVHSHEELRKAVAQQLHGPVQNRLLVATHWLKLAKEYIGSDVAKSDEHLDKATELINEINESDLRSAVRRLHPSLIRVSLLASLRSLADEFSSTFEVNVQIGSQNPETGDLWRTGLPEELRLAIYRVCEEAMNNAMKYANASRLEVTLDHPGEGKINVKIQDNGCGFDVDSVTPGFGILSMQDYCGAAGGAVQVNSVVGEGTTIATSFQISPRKSKATSSHALTENGRDRTQWDQGHDSGQKTTNLLIVDDQPNFCGLIKELLEPYPDFQVAAESHDGLSAINLVSLHKPDVVLLDVEMPGINGVETADEIKKRFPLVKVVLMSAFHQKEYIENLSPEPVPKVV